LSEQADINSLDRFRRTPLEVTCSLCLCRVLAPLMVASKAVL